VLAARLDGAGSEFARSLADMAHWLDWGVAVRAQARGRVRSVLGKTIVTYSLTEHDVRQFRRGLRVMGEMMFASGAEEIAPGVRGVAARLRAPDELATLERNGPRRAAA